MNPRTGPKPRKSNKEKMENALKNLEDFIILKTK